MSDTLAKRRLKTSSITVVVSLALVLFMLGLLGLVVLNASKLSNHIKENIGFQVILKNTATSAQIDALQQEISASVFAISAALNRFKSASYLALDASIFSLAFS